MAQLECHRELTSTSDTRQREVMGLAGPEELHHQLVRKTRICSLTWDSDWKERTLEKNQQTRIQISEKATRSKNSARGSYRNETKISFNPRT